MSKPIAWGRRMEKKKMQLKMIEDTIILVHTLEKDETYKVNHRKNIFSLSIFKKPTVATGVTSMCEDGKHILFLDYDDVCEWIVLQDLEMLQRTCQLSPFYLFTTKQEIIKKQRVGNYHAICLTKMSPSDVIGYQRMTHSDRAYMTMPLRNIFRSWVLRLSGKGKRKRPKLVSVIGEENLDQEISSAHLTLLKKFYPKLPKIDYSNKDKSKKIYKNIYETGNV